METQTIDLEPEYINLVPLFMEWSEYGHDNRQVAKENIEGMALLKDVLRQARKREVTVTFHGEGGLTLDGDEQAEDEVKEYVQRLKDHTEKTQ